MNSNARKQLQLLQDLRNALDRNEFSLHYQPKFDAGTGRPVGAEALLRWQHPTQGMLLPDKFIQLAEKTGLIIPIGDWVLNEACRQMREWYVLGYTDWRIAVNLSAMQFCHVGLVQSVAKALTTHQLPANSLTLEITETTAMSDADASMTVLQALSDMGVDLSIDDFGTGYSSLMYLKRLPANELKIDRGFVRDLERDSDDAAIVSAIVALGQALGLRIVAEGVETGMQQDFLTQLGLRLIAGLPARASIAGRAFHRGNSPFGAIGRRLIGDEGTRSLAISNGNRPMQKPKRTVILPPGSLTLETGKACMDKSLLSPAAVAASVPPQPCWPPNKGTGSASTISLMNKRPRACWIKSAHWALKPSPCVPMSASKMK